MLFTGEIPVEKKLLRELKETKEDLERMIQRHNYVVVQKNDLESQLFLTRQNLSELKARFNETGKRSV